MFLGPLERKRSIRRPDPARTSEEGSGVEERLEPPNPSDPSCVWNLTGNWERSTPLERRFPEDVVSASSKEVEEPD